MLRFILVMDGTISKAHDINHVCMTVRVQGSWAYLCSAHAPSKRNLTEFGMFMFTHLFEKQPQMAALFTFGKKMELDSPEFKKRLQAHALKVKDHTHAHECAYTNKHICLFI